MLESNDLTSSETVNITNNARDELLKVLTSTDTHLRIFLRFVQGQYSYSMSLDKQIHPRDMRTKINGISLLIDEISLPYVRGATLDFSNAGYKINNPYVDFSKLNEKGCTGKCTCGKGGCG